MMAPMILRSHLYRLIFFIAGLCLSSSVVAATPEQPTKLKPQSSQKTISVVASIRPLHSLLSQLMQGVAEPVLLLDQNQSAHHFSLRPSQRNTLSHADIIFWIGEPLESFMPRVMKALPRQVKTVALIANKKLHLLQPRSADAHHQHGHGQTSIDPHIWLSVDNALAMAGQMLQVLSQSDPEHTANYQENFRQLKSKLHQLKQQLATSLSSKNFNYLVYHDAFQYFEAELKIAPLAAISNDEEHAPGMRHLVFINQLINKKSISCIIFNTSQPPAVARKLTKAGSIQQLFVQPLGQSFKAGPELYFELMSSLAKAYQQCSQLQSPETKPRMK